MKKKNLALIILLIIICGTFIVYHLININNVPFKYVLRTFVPEFRERENPVPDCIIESDMDFLLFCQEYDIDAIIYEEGKIDYSNYALLTISWVGAKPYFTYSSTIKSIKIENENLRFEYNKDFSIEIFANSYISDVGDWGLSQRYTEVIVINRKYLKYAKDFCYFQNSG